MEGGDGYVPGKDLTNEECLKATIKKFDPYGAEGTSMIVNKALLDGKPLTAKYLVGTTLTSKTGCPVDFEKNYLPPSAYEDYPSLQWGYWVVIPPLSKGKHKIELAGSFEDFIQDFTLDITAK